MTTTLSELMLSVLFLVFANACTVFAFSTEEKHLRGMRAAVALFDRLVVRSFRPCEDRKFASQPERIASMRSRPVVRIAS
jgi:hypothetical protein